MRYPDVTKPSDLIGDTPLVDVSVAFPSCSARILAKIEYFNPGLSIKDRIAAYIVNRAEADGRLLPGGTIIECSSGNTGIGLAILAAERNYRFVCVMHDKHSLEKIALLKAYGAEVKVCDGSVDRDHPDSSHSYARRLELETPGSIWINQYSNQLNPETHYATTAPEIWQQAKQKITHFVASASTGGTLTGCARFLREKNPSVQIWAADAYGSALAHYHETGSFDPAVVHSYKAENVGKKFIPETLDFSTVDAFIKVSDGDAALMARKMAKNHALLLGYSCGAALQVVEQKSYALGPDDVVVVICPDHGSRYMKTIYNDQWMEEQGFFEPLNVLKRNGSI